MRYGLYDTKDNCWIGANDEGTGPKLFKQEEYELARIARQLACVRLGVPYGRIKVRKFEEDALVKKDELPTVLGGEEALRLLEEGKR